MLYALRSTLYNTPALNPQHWHHVIFPQRTLLSTLNTCTIQAYTPHCLNLQPQAHILFAGKHPLLLTTRNHDTILLSIPGNFSQCSSARKHQILLTTRYLGNLIFARKTPQSAHEPATMASCSLLANPQSANNPATLESCSLPANARKLPSLLTTRKLSTLLFARKPPRLLTASKLGNLLFARKCP
jgi:hypothetical protein